jgi:enterochelin esterase-like enzyme
MSAFRTLEISEPLPGGGDLRFVTVHSRNLRGRGDLTVWSPTPAVARPSDPLPLVVLLHGVYGSHWAWAFKGAAHRTAARLIADGLIPPLALAMPSDGLVADGTGYLRQHSGDYERWIVDDVPTVAAEAIPGVTADSPLFLAGLSMGGFGALRLGGRHPRRFQGISAHSAVTELRQLDDFMESPFAGADTVEDADLAELLVRRRLELPQLRFDCGTSDSLIGANRALHLELERHRVGHGYGEFPGGHDWPYWEVHLEDTLRFFGEILRNGRSGAGRH